MTREDNFVQEVGIPRNPRDRDGHLRANLLFEQSTSSHEEWAELHSIKVGYIPSKA